MKTSYDEVLIVVRYTMRSLVHAIVNTTEGFNPAPIIIIIIIKLTRFGTIHLSPEAPAHFSGGGAEP